MTNKERIQQLKWRCAGAARVEVDLMQPDNDHDWLIQQAEKLEDVRGMLDDCFYLLDNISDQNECLEKEIKDTQKKISNLLTWKITGMDKWV